MILIETIDDKINQLNDKIKEEEEKLQKQFKSNDNFVMLYGEDENVDKLCSRLSDDTILNECRRRFCVVGGLFCKNAVITACGIDNDESFDYKEFCDFVESNNNIYEQAICDLQTSYEDFKKNNF